jgi:hypothetical protein
MGGLKCSLIVDGVVEDWWYWMTGGFRVAIGGLGGLVLVLACWIDSLDWR